MYHAFVKRLVRRNFELVNEKNFDALIASCAPDIHHRFGGSHALGGERHDAVAFRAWCDRLGRLVPTLRLEVQDVWVKGNPWDTTAIARWTSTGSFPDGSPYNNHGVHVIRLLRGKVVSIDANEDSEAVAALLAALTATGIDEAAATPIQS
ncbi:hypothetical protein GSU69_08510 [Rathayibacter festucae]|uniref:SnoaL-like domain-containing protein n=1 Tax=Rathayibacter festucae TaxID=110937 RepID=A0ABX6GZ63_9MICO|nr:nuclear transport factor 2 family protein [Rathayibacter festucae]QHC62718.1 hypothetical protein GSU69_08510 [Rathayibacter festucae]